jgi:hypothetical protein
MKAEHAGGKYGCAPVVMLDVVGMSLCPTRLGLAGPGRQSCVRCRLIIDVQVLRPAICQIAVRESPAISGELE